MNYIYNRQRVLISSHCVMSCRCC